MIQLKLKKRGIKIKVINEPKEMQPPIAKDGAPKV